MKSSGLYVHIPYCKSKCIYCDFFSTRCVAADWNALVSALLNELKERVTELESIPETLYFGGGTPSLIPEELFMKLADGIKDIVGKNEPWKEFTIEVNPDDVDYVRTKLWNDSGVNRISLGIQSFVDSELDAIRRNHDSRAAFRAYNILRSVFSNISVDLIFGLPGQTLESWKSSVENAISIFPDHISAYSLMFEEKTPLTVLRDTGRMSFPSEEDCVEMWKYLTQALRERGYMQYEISNYSYPGKESLHNRRYWLGNPYLGIGPSAHSYDGNALRRSNPVDIKEYLSRFSFQDVCGGGSQMELKKPFYKEELLGRDELEEEMVMLRLRMREGLDLGEFSRVFGRKSLDRLVLNAQRHLHSGNLIMGNGRMMLSSRGIMVSDNIIVDLIR